MKSKVTVHDDREKDSIEVVYKFTFSRKEMSGFGLGPLMAEMIFGQNNPVSSAVMVLKFAKHNMGVD